VVGRFPNEGSCLRLFFATLLAASKSWRGVRMTPAMLKDILALRATLYGQDTGESVSLGAESSAERINRAS
jgi:hypothetical protein